MNKYVERGRKSRRIWNILLTTVVWNILAVGMAPETIRGRTSTWNVLIMNISRIAL